MLRLFQLILVRLVRITVIHDFAITQLHDTGRIFFRQFGVVCDHNYQAVFCYLLQKLHNLNAGFGIQCACRLVSEKNIRVVHQRTGNCHTLHLTAGHLIRLFMKLIAKTNFLQCLFRSLAAFAAGKTTNGQRQRHIGKDRLVWYKIITLEHETNGMISVGIPISVLIFLCGYTVYDEITGIVAVETSDNVQKCCFARTAGTKNRHKLIITQIQTDIL